MSLHDLVTLLPSAVQAWTFINLVGTQELAWLEKCPQFLASLKCDASTFRPEDQAISAHAALQQGVLVGLSEEVFQRR